ncbi:MAG: hypothetical protein R2797_05360 [Gelidibacter sp.]
MKDFLTELIPKIEQFSEKLNNTALLTRQHWILLDTDNSTYKKYIFKNNGELLISIDGKVSKGKWEYLNHQCILIEHQSDTLLFNHGFFEKDILALKLDGVQDFFLLVDENRFNYDLKTIKSVAEFLKNKYLDHKKISSDKYEIFREFKGSSLITGKFIEYEFRFEGQTGSVLFIIKKNQYSYSTYDQTLYFNNLDTCILSYIDYKLSK